MTPCSESLLRWVLKILLKWVLISCWGFFWAPIDPPFGSAHWLAIFNPERMFQVDIDFEKEPIGRGKDGKDVYFKDIWPSNEEIATVSQRSHTVDLLPFTSLLTSWLIAPPLPAGGPIQRPPWDVQEHLRGDHDRQPDVEPALCPIVNSLLVGPTVNVHPRAAIFQGHDHGPPRAPQREGRLLPAPPRRQHHHRPHLPSREHKQGQPSSKVPPWAGRWPEGLQLLWQPPGEWRGDGEGDLCQHPLGQQAAEGGGGPQDDPHPHWGEAARVRRRHGMPSFFALEFFESSWDFLTKTRKSLVSTYFWSILWKSSCILIRKKNSIFNSIWYVGFGFLWPTWVLIFHQVFSLNLGKAFWEFYRSNPLNVFPHFNPQKKIHFLDCLVCGIWVFSDLVDFLSYFTIIKKLRNRWSNV